MDQTLQYGNWVCDFDLLCSWVRYAHRYYALPHYIEACQDVGLPCILEGARTTNESHSALTVKVNPFADTLNESGDAFCARGYSFAPTGSGGPDASSVPALPALSPAQNTARCVARGWGQGEPCTDCALSATRAGRPGSST